MPSATQSEPPTEPDVSASSLALSVAHELNNIAASLFGFVALAAEQADAASPLRGCLGEIRIGVARVTNLAAVLEALAEVDGSPTRIAVRDCVGADAQHASGGGLSFRWECDPAAVVDADPERVQCAVRTLAHLGRPDSAGGSDVAFTVSRPAVESRCFSCGATLGAGSVNITLTADEVRRFDAGSRRRAAKSSRELIVTATVHAMHVAGGHVALDASRSSISLVLKTA